MRLDQSGRVWIEYRRLILLPIWSDFDLNFVALVPCVPVLVGVYLSPIPRKRWEQLNLMSVIKEKPFAFAVLQC